MMRAGLRQRADYTHKYNSKTGRHGWLRLTPAYSVKIVEELVDQFDRPMRILDPFSGTATTALSAAYHGHEGVTTDINPFLVWFGQAKTAQYSATALKRAQDACARSLRLANQHTFRPAPPPPIHKIERWWSGDALLFLRKLRAAIDQATEKETAERTLLLIAFCRSLISMSIAAFNHQSMSFKDEGQMAFDLDIDLAAMFADDVRFVLDGARDNPKGSGQVVLGDSRNPKAVLDGKFDCVITSPPYVNRMSYIRELRPYMYWLNFLVNGRDAGELDWTAIGGTWGIATSRLITWTRPATRFRHPILDDALDKIAHHDNRSGTILANYVAKYFDDMWVHFQGLPTVLSKGAEVHYIVGNSTFYGVLLPVEQLYAAMLKEVGLHAIECRPIRKRNSKKELIEFDVVGKWGTRRAKPAKSSSLNGRAGLG
jgi:hypothetical protein